MASVDKEDRKSVFVLLTKLKTLSLSAFEAGIDSSSRARVPKFQYLYAPIGDLVFRTFSQNFTASLSEQSILPSVANSRYSSLTLDLSNVTGRFSSIASNVADDMC